MVVRFQKDAISCMPQTIGVTRESMFKRDPHILDGTEAPQQYAYAGTYDYKKEL